MLKIGELFAVGDQILNTFSGDWKGINRAGQTVPDDGRWYRRKHMNNRGGKRKGAGRKPRLPHHGRGGSEHVGRIRIKLAKIIGESLGIKCEPEELRPAGGRQRNNTTMFDGYAWEVFAYNDGRKFVAGSFFTMTECVKAGKVTLKDGEISADYA
jgi:hypothetical protein